VDGFLTGLPLVFQPGKSVGLNATYHFSFTGQESRKATIVIEEKRVTVKAGHVGNADLKVTADTATWLGFLAKEKNLVWALLRLKIRLKGSPRLLVAFGKCFPQ
jgi:putative sterol carrier protein